MTPAPLATARLRLRPTAAADADAILDLFVDEATTRYWAHGPLADRAAAAAWIADCLAQRARGELLDWVGELADGSLAGICYLGDLSLPNRRAEIGYAVHRDLVGRGLAREMVERILGHAFEDLALHRVEADVDPRHDASLRLLARQGFVVEGRLRERWQATGELQDSVLLGLLAPEWTGSARGRDRDGAPLMPARPGRCGTGASRANAPASGPGARTAGASGRPVPDGAS